MINFYLLVLRLEIEDRLHLKITEQGGDLLRVYT